MELRWIRPILTRCSLGAWGSYAGGRRAVRLALGIKAAQGDHVQHQSSTRSRRQLVQSCAWWSEPGLALGLADITVDNAEYREKPRVSAATLTAGCIDA